MKKPAAILALLTVLSFASLASSGEWRDKTTPLKKEMWLLDAAFRNLVDALILGNPGAIEAPFRKVEEAKEATRKAVKRGELALSKNPDKMKLFAQMDEEFHKDLDALLEAAKREDMNKVERLTHKLLDGCVKCHEMFRR